MIGSARTGLDRTGCVPSIGVRAEQKDGVHAISLTTIASIRLDAPQNFPLDQHYIQRTRDCSSSRHQTPNFLRRGRTLYTAVARVIPMVRMLFSTVSCLGTGDTHSRYAYSFLLVIWDVTDGPRTLYGSIRRWRPPCEWRLVPSGGVLGHAALWNAFSLESSPLYFLSKSLATNLVNRTRQQLVYLARHERSLGLRPSLLLGNVGPDYHP